MIKDNIPKIIITASYLSSMLLTLSCVVVASDATTFDMLRNCVTVGLFSLYLMVMTGIRVSVLMMKDEMEREKEVRDHGD